MSHRTAGHTVQPLVELPFTFLAQAVGIRQQSERGAGPVQLTVTHQRGHVETADERPDATVVVLVGQVQVAAAVVLAPVTVTRVL